MMAWDLRRLRLLVELAERGTLSAVASALDYSPSAVSQQLSALEKESGMPLLEKAGRGVRLTDAGTLLAAHGRVLLAAAERATTDLAALSTDIRGTVRAGGLQSAARRLLVPAMARSMRSHPHLRIEIRELELEQALPELRLGTVDLIISDEYAGHPRPRPNGLRFSLLYEEPLRLVLAVGHPAARPGGQVRIEALRDDVWVASQEGTGHHAMIIGTCRSFGGFEPDLRHRSNDADVQLELVRATGAVGLLPQLALPLGDPSIMIGDLVGCPVRRELLIVTRDGPSTPALTAYAAALAEQADALHR